MTSVDPLEKTITARGLIRFAKDYFEAFQIVQKAKPQFSNLYDIKYYLLCHSLELAFKAYLRNKEYSRKQLKDFNHDLIGLVLELKNKFSYIFDKNDITAISSVNKYYSSKQFEYLQIGYRYHVDISDLEKIVTKYLNQIYGILR